MESFFVLMSELTVLGEGQDRTKQTTMIFQSSGQMLLNAAAQVQHKQKHKVQSFCDWRVLERLCGGGSVWSRSQGNGWIFRQNSGPLFWISSQALVERLYHSLSFIFYCCPVDFVIHLPTQPLVYFLGSSLGQGIALTKESWSLLEKKRIFTFMILF